MNSRQTRLFRVQHVIFFIVLLAAALVALTHPTVTLADAGKMPDLRGVWRTLYAAPTDTGRLVREGRCEITRQDGELLWGADVWHPIDPKTGKAQAEWIHNPFVGSLDSTGNHGLLAAKGVQIAFRLVGPDELELELASFEKLDGFPPTAFYAALKRGAIDTVSRTDWPDLSGTWRGRSMAVYPDGVRPTSLHLDLVRQDGQLLWVDDVWSPTGPLTAKTDPKTILREQMLGSLNPAGTGGVLAKAGVRMGFRILSPDRIEMEFIRVSGDEEPAMAFYSVLGRGSEEPMAPVAERINLVGTWTADYRYALPDRPVDATSSLVITRQEGNAVWAYDVWTQPGEKGVAPMQHRDPMRGSVSPDQSRGALAKTGAYLTFRVLDADHLEFGFTVVGIDRAPAAFFGVYTRKR